MVTGINSITRMFLFAAQSHKNRAVGCERQPKSLPDKSKIRRDKPDAVTLH